MAEGWTTLPFAFSNTGRLDTERTVRESNPGAGEVFRTRPDRPWGPPSLLYNGYRVSLPGLKRPGRGLNHPPLYIDEVKEIVELYFCFCRLFYGRALALLLPFSKTGRKQLLLAGV